MKSIYPKKATTVPGSGSAVYLHLINNIRVPGKMPHEVWYNGLAAQLKVPERYAFRGFYPIGETLYMSYAGSHMQQYTFTGNEKNAVYVKDLSPDACIELNIPEVAKLDDKVFNPNFVKFDDLTDDTKTLNELPTMSLAKAFSSFIGSYKPFYTEVDIVSFLTRACKDLSSQEMMNILHSNHVTWCAHVYSVTGEMQPDIRKEFYNQNDPDFYIKDIGTVMPAILYTMALLGVDPDTVLGWLNYEIWGIQDVAKEVAKITGIWKLDK